VAAVRIEWKRRNDEGERHEVMAERVGDEWSFFVREGRFDEWKPLENPPIDEWFELLDGVRRRVGRKLLKPDEEKRLARHIRERFPQGG
jgi:hypothetical protein